MSYRTYVGEINSKDSDGHCPHSAPKYETGLGGLPVRSFKFHCLAIKDAMETSLKEAWVPFCEESILSSQIPGNGAISSIMCLRTKLRNLTDEEAGHTPKVVNLQNVLCYQIAWCT